MFGTCKQCGHQAGIFGIKGGLCKSCREIEPNADTGIDVLSSMMENSLKREAEGANVARTCLVEGLRKGEVIKLSYIDNLFAETYEYDPQSRSTGFIKQMIEYVQSGEVINVNTDNGDTVFIHKDYASQYLTTEQ